MGCQASKLSCRESARPCQDDKPDFEHVPDFLQVDDAQHIVSSVVLGEDPSSIHFATRQKAIRFVLVINGRVVTLTQDFFRQSAEYNDFSGGYNRHYTLIKEDLFDGPLGDVVLKFAAYYNIPEKTVILAQIQKSVFNGEARQSRVSVTGQGIHTDGADRAVIVGLHRGSNVVGACNQFHAELDGSQPLCEPIALGDGECIFFKDNQIYHYVSPATVESNDGHPSCPKCSRTILIMHAPAEMFLDGTVNEANKLGAKDSPRQLRLSDQSPQNVGDPAS